MEKWPNFFIVGAVKCGTSSLYEYLKNTKGIFMSPIKEPHFFSVSVNDNLIFLGAIRDKKKYLNLFKDVKDEIVIGEATTSYLWDPKAPKLIHDIIPNAKIIIMLRDPVERAYSHFLKEVSTGYDNHPFSDSIKRALNSPPDYSGRIIDGGLYCEQVKRFLDIFGRDQVRIYISEEFFKDARKTVIGILDFLKVSSEPSSNTGTIYNAYVEPRGKVSEVIIKNKLLRKASKYILPVTSGPMIKTIFGKTGNKPTMSNKDKQFLEDFYRDDVKKLKKLLSRDLPWPVAQK